MLPAKCYCFAVAKTNAAISKSLGLRDMTDCNNKSLAILHMSDCTKSLAIHDMTELMLFLVLVVGAYQAGLEV